MRQCSAAFYAFLDQKSLFSSHALVSLMPMPEPAMSWPHAPSHQLSENGTYFVPAGTYLKAHYFRTPQRLDVLQRGLLAVARDFSWELEAWAIFSNHYHFVAHALRNRKDVSRKC